MQTQNALYFRIRSSELPLLFDSPILAAVDRDLFILLSLIRTTLDALVYSNKLGLNCLILSKNWYLSSSRWRISCALRLELQSATSVRRRMSSRNWPLVNALNNWLGLYLVQISCRHSKYFVRSWSLAEEDSCDTTFWLKST